MAGKTRAAEPGAVTAGHTAPGGEPPGALRGYYRQMALIRAFELRAAQMYTQARIGGYCHLNLGEEATVVGLMAALEPRDYLFTTYREHGYALARGLDPGRVMAELFGKTTGVSGGWGGSMHLFDTKARLLGGYGIVGGQIPPATGAALALAYRGEPGPDAEAVMCLMGDGTTNIGAFHESLNLAALWRLPIVYVIINNGLGMGTPVDRAAAEPDLYKRGCSYRIPGERVDGDDVLAVRDAARDALRRARAERQPGLLEAVSYRLRGHSVVDPAAYRSREETERLRALDPLPAFRARLLEAGVLDEEAALRIDEEADQQVTAAVTYAGDSPDPTPDQLFAHAYASPVPNAPRQLPGDPVVSAQ
ncbi:MAG: pyruvate dehydrogenase (acetyl-transferring) E1 component subunit alpha [Streptosporangiaceae bacterium]